MAPSNVILSQTLTSITATKIRELQKRRGTYGIRKQAILDSARTHRDVRKRASAIHTSLVELDLWKDPEFHNVKRWIAQSLHDPSVPQSRLAECEQRLIHRLDIESRKLDMADLYSRLLTEWIEQQGNSNPEPQTPEDSIDESDPFDEVQPAQRERLEDLRTRFARVVFEPFDTDEVEIDLYLHSLFAGDKREKVLRNLRSDIQTSTSQMHKFAIDRQDLIWTIKALRNNDLLNEEKKVILKEFLRDEAVLREIMDVINMRLRDFDNWSWDMGDEGMPVMPRQSLNGKWRVMADDDLIQAILTHAVGTRWSVQVKTALKNVVTNQHIWNSGHVATEDEKKMRRYFGTRDHGQLHASTEGRRLQTYQEHFFMSPLPSALCEEAGGYDGDDDSSSENKKSAKEVKQLLLRTLATEVHLRQAFDGEVAVVQSDFQWFATSVPHSSVYATLRFIGFSEQAIAFVRKFLETPLNMLDGSPVKTRKRGLPMAHIMEKLLGEIILFFMDVAVNLESSQVLYRFHDDLWLVGKPDLCAKAWATMKDFARLMGLEFNQSKTGSVYLTTPDKTKVQAIADALPDGPVGMDFLVLDPDSGEWCVKEEQVSKHVDQLRKQLGQATSVLDWVKTWNSCIGRFFGYTFGSPAQCFGKLHLEMVLRLHQQIQQSLFDGEGDNAHDASSHLKQMISTRLSVPTSRIPDAFLSLPEVFGGLGLVNPFVNLCLVQEDLIDSPATKMQEFLKEERERYELDRKEFEELSERERRRRWRSIFDSDWQDSQDADDGSGADRPVRRSAAQKFPSLEEYTKYRETSSRELAALYERFLSAPQKARISLTEGVDSELKALKPRLQSINFNEEDDVMKDLRDDKELVWLLEYHRDELMEEFGGLRCAERDLLPLGVLGAMKDKKVTWQMVL